MTDLGLMVSMIIIGFVSCSKNDDSPEVKSGLCPDSNHPHLIDLGLPSGTKWACCNVGAKSPESFGGYYAFGETSEKSNYSLKNYEFRNENPSGYESYYCIISEISGTQYDVAYVKWGKSWQMPTSNQYYELERICKLECTSYNNTEGIKCIGSNGNAIFFPAAGYKKDSEHINSDGYAKIGQYWIGYGVGQNSTAYIFGFTADQGLYKLSNMCERVYGCTVRAVGK